MKSDMPEYRLLVIDLDGTLYDTHGQMRESDVAAVRMLSASGVLVTIATGRPYLHTLETARALGVSGPFACANGSQVVDLDPGLVRKLRGHLTGRKVLPFALQRDCLIYDALAAPFARALRPWATQQRASERVLDDEALNGPGGCTMLFAAGSLDELVAVRQEIVGDLGPAVWVQTLPIRQVPDLWMLYVRPANATKGTALRTIAEHHDLPLSQTVCVGDDENDLAMFAAAGCAYAMGHAPLPVKHAAHHVLVETNDTGGALWTIARERFGITAPEQDDRVPQFANQNEQ